jgi:hypothetical protein
MSSRYENKPLLRLLECYVLWAIKELGEKEAQILDEMTPKLKTIYQKQGDWREIISSVMALPADLPTKIQAMWEKNKRIGEGHSVTLEAQKFAEMFVDQNLTT